MLIERIDHIQLAMPAGRESQAIDFYQGLLGIPEVAKPEKLVARGGAWFEKGDLRVHLGVEADFRPARKAHPAFRVSSLAALTAKFQRAGIEIIQDDLLPGFDRFYASDPFGNRLEFLQPKG